MTDNLLMAVKQEIQVSVDSENVKELILKALDGSEKFYSYIVYAKYENDTLTGWIIQYNISQNENFNTLSVQNIVDDIVNIINRKRDDCKKVIGYGQPDIETVILAYDPLVRKLAKRQAERWKQYDYEDLCQICRYVMLKLYRKGYYIHRRLLYKAFENEIWMQVRKERGKPQIVSFEDTFYKDISGDGEKLLVADTIPDISTIEREETEYEKEVELKIFEELKEVIIEYIGVRQWNELVRDYGHCHTTSTTRKKMQKIKNYLNTLGLTRKEFNRKYYE